MIPPFGLLSRPAAGVNPFAPLFQQLKALWYSKLQTATPLTGTVLHPMKHRHLAPLDEVVHLTTGNPKREKKGISPFSIHIA